MLVISRKYWNKLSHRLKEEGSEPVTICHRLKLKATDGKMRETDCANTEGIFRIIQSIPSPKAAKQGGDVAGKAREDVEFKSGKKVVSGENFLGIEKIERLS